MYVAAGTVGKLLFRFAIDTLKTTTLALLTAQLTLLPLPRVSTLFR